MSEEFHFEIEEAFEARGETILSGYVTGEITENLECEFRVDETVTTTVRILYFEFPKRGLLGQPPGNWCFVGISGSYTKAELNDMIRQGSKLELREARA